VDRLGKKDQGYIREGGQIDIGTKAKEACEHGTGRYRDKSAGRTGQQADRIQRRQPRKHGGSRQGETETKAKEAWEQGQEDKETRAKEACGQGQGDMGRICRKATNQRAGDRRHVVGDRWDR
jgi:hypothetical protein